MLRHLVHDPARECDRVGNELALRGAIVSLRSVGWTGVALFPRIHPAVSAARPHVETRRALEGEVLLRHDVVGRPSEEFRDRAIPFEQKVVGVLRIGDVHGIFPLRDLEATEEGRFPSFILVGPEAGYLVICKERSGCEE